MTSGLVAEIARFFDENVTQRLIKTRKHNIDITEEVFQAAADNR
jgi:hypothetical protein